MAKSELLPCPFCGGEHIDLYEGNYGNGVYCMSCGVMMGEPIHLEFRVSERVSMAQAIAAWNTRAETKAERDLRDEVNWLNAELHGAELANGGTLTAEQVREAIYNGSSYASYDGAKFYADGIGMQAIADELNAELHGAEIGRTCRVTSAIILYDPDGYETTLSCGHVVHMPPEDFDYCPSCGRKVV